LEKKHHLESCALYPGTSSSCASTQVNNCYHPASLCGGLGGLFENEKHRQQDVVLLDDGAKVLCFRKGVRKPYVNPTKKSATLACDTFIFFLLLKLLRTL